MAIGHLRDARPNLRIRIIAITPAAVLRPTRIDLLKQSLGRMRTAGCGARLEVRLQLHLRQRNRRVDTFGLGLRNDLGLDAVRRQRMLAGQDGRGLSRHRIYKTQARAFCQGLLCLVAQTDLVTRMQVAGQRIDRVELAFQPCIVLRWILLDRIRVMRDRIVKRTDAPCAIGLYLPVRRGVVETIVHRGHLLDRKTLEVRRGLLVDQLLRPWLKLLPELVRVPGAVDSNIRLLRFHVIGELLVTFHQVVFQRRDVIGLLALLVNARHVAGKPAALLPKVFQRLPHSRREVGPLRIRWRLSR